MQPRPIADTFGPVLPKCRVSIGSSLMTRIPGSMSALQTGYLRQEIVEESGQKTFLLAFALRLLSYRIQFLGLSEQTLCL